MAKKIVYLGNSRKVITSFPLEAQEKIAIEFIALLNGLEPSNWKPMSSIGQGVREIRVKDRYGIYRVIYITKIEDCIHILHAFQKKTQKTTKHDLDLAKQRLKGI